MLLYNFLAFVFFIYGTRLSDSLIKHFFYWQVMKVPKKLDCLFPARFSNLVYYLLEGLEPVLAGSTWMVGQTPALLVNIKFIKFYRICPWRKSGIEIFEQIYYCWIISEKLKNISLTVKLSSLWKCERSYVSKSFIDSTHGENPIMKY